MAPDLKKSLALVIPFYNEEASVPRLINAIESFRREHGEVVQIVFVNDGSTDITEALIRQNVSDSPGYVVVSLARNFGHQIAITAGLEFVTADAAVIMDGDLQDPLAVIPRMVEQWRRGYDVVYGIRHDRLGETWFKQKTASVFYTVFRRITEVEIPPDVGDFRLVSRPVIDAYKRFSEHRPFFRGLVTWMGFNQTGVKYIREPRVDGATKYPLSKMLRLAFDSMASFSDRPLRLAAGVGLIVSLLSSLGLVWALTAKYILNTAISGWTSLIFGVFLFGGLQLFFLGIIGVYLARVYEEVQGRPRYVIRDLWSTDLFRQGNSENPPG